jgi:putative transposase
MQRVERHIVIGNKNLDKIFFLSKNLYNYANYLIRQEFTQNNKLVSEYELTTKLAKEKQADYIALPAQTSQQVVKILFKNWKSFF